MRRTHRTSPNESASEEPSGTEDAWSGIAQDFAELEVSELAGQRKGSTVPRIYRDNTTGFILHEYDSDAEVVGYDDMPPLEDMPMAETSAAGLARETRARMVPDRPIVELPMAEEAFEAWQSFERDREDDVAAASFRRFYFRMVGVNQHLVTELDRERHSMQSARSQLAWTRRELARSIQRERETIASFYQLTAQRAQNLDETRQHIRIREEMIAHPLSDELSDDAFEGDYLDDPSMLSANAALDAALHESTSPPAYPGRGPAMRAMAAGASSSSAAATGAPTSMTTRARTGRRPILPKLEETCLTFFMKVNGLDALVLLDSGSTGDSMSPEFARVAGVRAFELENPAILQLGCVGSRSRINYGAQVLITFGEITSDTYLDIVNLDRYDLVLGTPFMRRLGVQMDFKTNSIIVQGTRYPALSPAEEDAGANRRRQPRASRPTAPHSPVVPTARAISSE